MSGMRGRPLFRIAGVVLAVAIGVGCAPSEERAVPSDELVLYPVPERDWPKLEDDQALENLAQAASLSLGYLGERPSDQLYVIGGYRRTAQELARGTERLLSILSSGGGSPVLKDEFVLLRSIGRDGKGEVLLTGYFEPILDARRQPVADYRFPVYQVPDDLVSIELRDFADDLPDRQLIGRVVGRGLEPYPDRETIDWGSGLAVPADPIAYVDDQIELFFLHIQGSGTLRLADGTLIRAGYAAKNGQPYRSIGRLLLEEEVIPLEEMSMQAITAYLELHPEDVRRVLTHNPSYVFFRELEARDGPLGCYELPIVAGRSIATDRRLFPAPVVGWLDASLPDPAGVDRPLRRFVVNHDTGGAIRGPGRVDLFIGRGDEAGEIAGRTKHLGELYIFLPKR